MAKKRYYWMRLKENFFREKRIKKLRQIAGGDTFTIIYLKMQLLSLQSDGLLEYEGVENSFAEELALEIDEDIENVKVTLMFLQKNNLIEETVDNTFLLPEAVENMGSESSSTERVRKHREKKKLLENKEDDVDLLHCNTDVTNSNVTDCYSNECNGPREETEQRREEQETDIDLETEIKTELEQQQDIERKDVVGLISIYFPYLNEKDLNTIADEFLKINKDLYYLSEKLILAVDAKNIENKVGYLLKAIKEDYQIRYATSLENLATVWEQELLEKPNNLIIADKVKYYRFKCNKER
ncbi:phage replisome organizer N-terminal domain-containing protein [Terrisporobacter mayombei]|uniref:Phage replisome organiser N-terminal domain-containing protein n=1 Tax=Terrisporobacter mayombei TaxID=1541 RepID=A0ABY9PY96_9FIRM|nr:phage replisome organizer N-terminal domain-containing protein [Terrisporobacter mayombei]MCC3868474.1 phage replisome organizer N-terminal domain-containing protein [Terrisporobacter mayombei]WMT80627.1 hypothetical protein TEMA_09480 [Terrisporobacter mayombei]